MALKNYSYYLDPIFYSLMLGAGEAYFCAYGLKLGYDGLQAGVIATIPVAIGGIFQLLAPFGINKLQSYKNWVVIGAIIQAFIFLVISLSSHLLQEHYYIFFFLVTLYWILNLSITPAWNAWIAKIIPVEEMKKFFSVRNLLTASGNVIGLAATGYLLFLAKDIDKQLLVFKYVFIVCFVARLLSAFSLSAHDRSHDKEDMNTFSFKKLLQANEYDYALKVVNFICLFKLGVYFSASFFTPYMLKFLNFNFLEYMQILVSAFVGRILFLRLFRKFFVDIDIGKLLLISTLGVSIVPFLWTLSVSHSYLLYLEILTGIAWGGVELAFLLYCFELVPANVQPYFMSYHNFVHTVTIGIGSVLGALTFYYFKELPNVYYIVFYSSACLRLLSFAFFPKIVGQRALTYFSIFYKLLAVRPNMGIVSRPLGSVVRKIKKMENK